MAQLPYFVFSPTTLLSAIGLMRGRDTTPATPAADWREATIDVIIPARNEQDHIVRCLASVLRQTRRPRQIVLVDDGSSDATVARARAFCEFHRADLVLVWRRTAIGKTPTLKRQTRSTDADVLFVLDADTVLESEDYIARTVQELYEAVGIASACGTVLPLREKDRRAADGSSAVRAFVDAFPAHRAVDAQNPLGRLARAVTNTYREVLYLFLQRFVYRGQMAAFGTLCNPVGCAVAYRREYLETLFAEVEPRLGDDLTNSEDIFIGLAMLNEGYRNIHLPDVCARTVEPPVHRLPKQVYLWSSAFLQSAFYFDALLRSPFKMLRRRRGRGPGRESGGTLVPAIVQSSAVAAAGLGGLVPPGMFFSMATGIESALPGAWPMAGRGGAVPASDRRRIQEPYRQAFGREHTTAFGRPAGWALLSSAVEKTCFPSVLLAMALLENWEGLLITIAAETLLTIVTLTVVMKNQRLEYLIKGVAVTPVRYTLVALELVTLARFAIDVWLTKNRKWRK